MKLSCISYSYHRAFEHGAMNLGQFIIECASNRLDGVELLDGHFESTDKEYLARVKKLCTDNYLDIAMLSTGGIFELNDEQLRADEVQQLKAWIDVACFLGAPIVRFFVGHPDELHSGSDKRYNDIVAAVHTVCDYAAQSGIVMALENHGGWTADYLERFFSQVNHDYLRLNLDVGNFPPIAVASEETYRSIERCLPLAAIIHGKFYDIDEYGESVQYDWSRIMQLIRAAGFEGYISVEYEGSDADEYACTKRVIANLRTRLMSEVM